MLINSLLLSLCGIPLLAGLAQGHMNLRFPVPINHPANPYHNDHPDSQYDFPLKSRLPDQFPCRGHLKYLGSKEATAVETFNAGNNHTFVLVGDYTHYGGSCQISLSYDDGITWRVIKSFEGGCPKRTKYDKQHFGFNVPKDAPAKKGVLFAWSWHNREQEMYMNCAVVDIDNPRNTYDPLSPPFQDYPHVLVANLDDGCRTPLTDAETKFPDSGKYVEKSTDKKYPLRLPKGDACGPFHEDVTTNTSAPQTKTTKPVKSKSTSTVQSKTKTTIKSKSTSTVPPHTKSTRSKSTSTVQTKTKTTIKTKSTSTVPPHTKPIKSKSTSTVQAKTKTTTTSKLTASTETKSVPSSSTPVGEEYCDKSSLPQNPSPPTTIKVVSITKPFTPATPETSLIPWWKLSSTYIPKENRTSTIARTSSKPIPTNTDTHYVPPPPGTTDVEPITLTKSTTITVTAPICHNGTESTATLPPSTLPPYSLLTTFHHTDIFPDVHRYPHTTYTNGMITKSYQIVHVHYYGEETPPPSSPTETETEQGQTVIVTGELVTETKTKTKTEIRTQTKTQDVETPVCNTVG